MTTIKDIAKKAGVSVATVSYVLNNTRYVSPDKLESVLKAVQELNYVPNAAARGLRMRESKTICLTVSDITNPFYPEISKACEDIAQSMGYTVIIMNTNDLPERTAKAASQLRSGRVDGLILTTALETDRPVLEELVKGGYPVVLAHRSLEGLDVDTVISNNFGGAKMATKYLLGLGHKRIAFMTGGNSSSVSSMRTQGYLQAMREADLEVMQEWLTSGSARYFQSYETTRFLVNLPFPKRPTAIINISDIGALGVMDAASDLHLSIPGDLSVIGFDDLFIAQTGRVQLTTVQVPSYELGRQATELLLSLINKTNVQEKQNIILPVKLIIRKTCGEGWGN